MYRVNVVNKQQEFFCKAENNLLEAMIRQGVNAIPVGCRGGGCGVCRVKVLQGQYQCRRMSRACVSVEQEKQGIVLACQVIPESDMQIMLY